MTSLVFAAAYFAYRSMLGNILLHFSCRLKAVHKLCKARILFTTYSLILLLLLLLPQRRSLAVEADQERILGSNMSADLYEHVRQETGRGATPSQRATPEQPPQQPSSPAIAAVPAARPYQGPYSASNSPAPGPSYQDFESESEGSVSTTPGKLHISNVPHTASLFCNNVPVCIRTCIISSHHNTYGLL